jgi:hypothetical protein
MSRRPMHAITMMELGVESFKNMKYNQHYKKSPFILLEN